MKTYKNKVSTKLIYIGPSLPKGLLQQNMIFTDGIPSHLTDLLNQIPEIEKMFVPIVNLAVKEKERSTKGTPLFQYNQKILEEIKNGI